MKNKSTAIIAIVAALSVSACATVPVPSDPKLYCQIEEGLAASDVAKYIHNSVTPKWILEGTNYDPQFVQDVANYMAGKPLYSSTPDIIAYGQVGDQRVEITAPDSSPNADKNRQSRKDVEEHFTNECLKNGPRKIRDYF